jgi:hypothetical protein
VIGGCACVRSTATDLAIYVDAHLSPDGPLGTAIELASTLQRGTGSDDVGLGWRVADTPRGRVCWHNGATAGSERSWHSTAQGERRSLSCQTPRTAASSTTGFAMTRVQFEAPA